MFCRPTAGSANCSRRGLHVVYPAATIGVPTTERHCSRQHSIGDSPRTCPHHRSLPYRIVIADRCRPIAEEYPAANSRMRLTGSLHRRLPPLRIDVQNQTCWRSRPDRGTARGHADELRFWY